jgi:hypothetical protein
VVSKSARHKRRSDMQTITADTFAPTITSRTRSKWTGRIITAIPVLFLLFDIAIKLINPPMVAEASEAAGVPAYLAQPLGIVLAICLGLYLYPRTAPLGAVLMTGYLGGAVFSHLRTDNPWFTHTLFPIYVAIFLWLGLYLRDARVRALIRPR